MARKVLYPAVFVLVLMLASPALASWSWWGVDTATPGGMGIDGRFYNDPASLAGNTLVQSGAVVQFILDTEGDGLDDPLSFFDTDASGVIDMGPEMAAVTAWINAGCAPIDDDILITDSTGAFTGELLMGPAGEVRNTGPGGGAYTILPGEAADQFGYRAWSLTPQQMEEFCTVLDVQAWYMTGRELGSYGSGDTGWAISGGDPTVAPGDWAGFSGIIGYEVYGGLRPQNTLDTHLATCIPEPGTMLLIGSAALLALVRRKK